MAGREDSPDIDDRVAYIAESSSQRAVEAQQALRLLDVQPPGTRRSRTSSISSSVTDLEAPIFQRETATRKYVSLLNF